MSDKIGREIITLPGLFKSALLVFKWSFTALQPWLLHAYDRPLCIITGAFNFARNFIHTPTPLSDF